MNWKKVWAMQQANRQRWLKVNPALNDNSGIYVLLRTDENGINYFYVGQAVKILSRLSSHLSNYQHIDLSIRNHGLYDAEKRPYGWRVEFYIYPKEELDEREREYIRKYLELGYQTRNKTIGGQNEGKDAIGDSKSTKGYREGVDYGYKKALKEIAVYFEKYLCVSIQSPTNKIKERKHKEFIDLILDKGVDNENN